MEINNIPIKQDKNPVEDSTTQVSAEEFNGIVDTVKKSIVNKLGTTTRDGELYITHKLAGDTDVLETQMPKATVSTPGIMSKDDKSNLNKAVKSVSPRFGDSEKVYIDIEFVDKDAEVINIEHATQQAAGVMSAEDKAKLDSLSPAENYPLVSQTINGDSYNLATDETESLTLYAPTESGSEGYILASTGSGAPNWIPQADIMAGNSDHARLADDATKASQDSMGRVITETYLTKEEAGDIDAYNEVRHLINGKEYKVATTDPTTNNVTIYAPTDDGGNAGYLLQSGGTGNAPTWADPADFTVGAAIRADYATKDSSGNIITDTYATKNEINGISTNAQQAKTLAEQANQNVALQQGAIDSLEEQLSNIGETGVATSAEQVTFKVGTTGLTKVNVQGALEEVAGKFKTDIDPNEVYDTNKGVKVALGGTVVSPTVGVTVTTGAVNASNSGLVSGATVKEYVDSLKTNLENGDVTVDQATNAKQLDNFAASSYAKKADSIYAHDSINGVAVSLGGTLSNPTVSISVNGGTIIDGSSSIVNANDVYDFVTSSISDQSTFTTKNNGLVPASGTSTSAFLKGDGSWATPKDATVSQTLQNTANAEYPLLLAPSGQSATSTKGAYFDSMITVNPNTNTITASKFKGTATNAEIAAKATNDGNGSEIATSYIKKGTLANVATSGSYNDLTNRPSNATTSKAGLMSSTDKTKLDSLSNDVVTTTTNGLMSATDKVNLNSIKNWYDEISGSDTDNVINKWGEIEDFLSGISESDTLDGLIDAVDTKVETLKSDIVNGTVVAAKATTATKIGTSTKGSATQPVYISGGNPLACTYSLNKTVPSDAVFTDTHYTAKNIVSNSANATSNAAATNGNVHINLVENNTCRSGIKIVGSGATTVSSDANGNITILSSDTNTTYVAMKGATSSSAGTMGLVPRPVAGQETSYLKGDGTWDYKINEFGYTGTINIGTNFSNATGWFRIARTRNLRSTPSVFRVALYRNNSSSVPEAYVFDVCTSFRDKVSITQVAGQASTIAGHKLIDKIRVTRDTSTNGTILYFDFHVNLSTTGNTFYWYVIGNAFSYTSDEVVHNPTITSTTETHEFTTVNGFKTNGDIYEGDSALSSKYIQTTKGISTSGANKGVKVTLGGTVGSPTISVTTTTSGVTANNTGVVSGAEVKSYVDTNAASTATFKAQTSSSNAVNGLVPAPSSANATKFLRGDGTWVTPTNTTYGLATSTSNGLMSSAQAKIVVPNAWSGADAFGDVSKDKITYIYGKSFVYLGPNDAYVVLHSGNIGTYKAGDSSNLGGVAASSYAKKTDAISAYGSRNGVDVSLGGTLSEPTISVSVNGGTIASGSSSIVNANDVYNHVKTSISNQTSFTTQAKGLVPASGNNTSAFLRGDGTWQTPTITKSNVISALGYTPAEEVENTMVWGGFLNTAAYATDYAIGTVLKVNTDESLYILKDGTLVSTTLSKGTKVIVSHETYASGTSNTSGKVFVEF